MIDTQVSVSAGIADFPLRTPASRTERAPHSTSGASRDDVSLSSDALAASETQELGNTGGISNQRIADLREQIARGVYLSDDKIDATVDRLYEELFTRRE